MEITASHYKEIVVLALETFKHKWPEEVKWDYRIEEVDNIYGKGVQIFVSVNGNGMLLYSRSYFNGVNSPPIIHAWRRIMIDIVTGGISSCYQNAVLIHRSGRHPLGLPIDIANNCPLTPEEVFK